MRKNRVPFFSKSYCREMLREFSTTGIVFASIEFVASMLSFFGITQNLLSMLLFGANVYIQSSAVSYVSLFCFVAGFVFVVKHLVRSAWDFRGSIPVAKRTMLISAFTAMLACAAEKSFLAMMAAHFGLHRNACVGGHLRRRKHSRSIRRQPCFNNFQLIRSCSEFRHGCGGDR